MIDEKKLERGDLCDICRSAHCSNCFDDDDFEEWIARQPKVGEWIPVSERLPENADEYVLITVNGTYKNITYEDAIMLAVYDKDEGWIIDGYQYRLTAQVTAWQPLPESYNGESK